MSSAIEFDSKAVAARVHLCEQEGELIRSGVSPDSQEIKLLRLKIATKMVMLLPNLKQDEKTNLLMFLLRDDADANYANESVNNNEGVDDPVDINK
jgi:hypothetical protein